MGKLKLGSNGKVDCAFVIYKGKTEMLCVKQTHLAACLLADVRIHSHLSHSPQVSFHPHVRSLPTRV